MALTRKLILADDICYLEFQEINAFEIYWPLPNSDMKSLHGSTLQDVTLMNTILVNKKIMSARYCLLTLGFPFNKNINGGFQLEFVNVSISWIINHMTCYKL